MNTPERDETARPEPRRQYGGKWKGRGGRRLQNEGRRDSREESRGGRSEDPLRSRDWARLLEDWRGEDEPGTGSPT